MNRTATLLLLAALPIQGWAGDDDEVPLDQIVVTSTRTPGLIRDEPLRVEAVPADEIEENLTVQPGNLSSLLNELPGVRVQSAAPGLGGAGLQLRGMPTRHTLVLTDGLPLLGTLRSTRMWLGWSSRVLLPDANTDESRSKVSTPS